MKHIYLSKVESKRTHLSYCGMRLINSCKLMRNRDFD